MAEIEYQKEAKKAERVCGYLNSLLVKTLPRHAQNYEVTHERVYEYVNPILGSLPLKVGIRNQPTYEFYLKSITNEQPLEGVMLLHGPDLREKISGGIKNERKHFHIDFFRENLEEAIEKIESGV